MIVGTYTNSCESDGIYVYNFNTETADFQLKSATKGVENPSFLAISEDKNMFMLQTKAEMTVKFQLLITIRIAEF